MSKEKKFGRGRSIHNPFPASLASAFLRFSPPILNMLTTFIGECEKASQILESFVNPRFVGLDVGIPRKILARAKVSRPSLPSLPLRR